MRQAPQTSEELKPGPQHTCTRTGTSIAMKSWMEN